MLSYREQNKYLLHEFVVMPDHFHLILTPAGITLERSMQLVKGGFSFQLNKNLKAKRDIWQPSFLDRRVRDSLEYAKYKDYIWQNPVKRGLRGRRRSISTVRRILHFAAAWIRYLSG